MSARQNMATAAPLATDLLTSANTGGASGDQLSVNLAGSPSFSAVSPGVFGSAQAYRINITTLSQLVNNLWTSATEDFASMTKVHDFTSTGNFFRAGGPITRRWGKSDGPTGSTLDYTVSYIAAGDDAVPFDLPNDYFRWTGNGLSDSTAIASIALATTPGNGDAVAYRLRNGSAGDKENLT